MLIVSFEPNLPPNADPEGLCALLHDPPCFEWYGDNAYSVSAFNDVLKGLDGSLQGIESQRSGTVALDGSGSVLRAETHGYENSEWDARCYLAIQDASAACRELATLLRKVVAAAERAAGIVVVSGP